MSRMKNNYENSRFMRFKRWVDGETDLLLNTMEIVPAKEPAAGEREEASKDSFGEKDGKNPPVFSEGRGLLYFRRFYQAVSVLLCCGIILVLLWTVAYLPSFGNAGNPDNNEVSARYIEQGLQETGAVNIVTGICK